MASLAHAASAAKEPCGRRRLDGRARSYALWLAQDVGDKERDREKEYVFGAAAGFRFTGGFRLARVC